MEQFVIWAFTSMNSGIALSMKDACGQNTTGSKRTMQHTFCMMPKNALQVGSSLEFGTRP